MKKITFGGEVRKFLKTNTSAAILGKLYSDKRTTGQRVKAILDSRLAGPTLYKLYSELSKTFPEYTVKVLRYQRTSRVSDVTRQGISVHFTKKVEA
jgi:hypothetical protein